MQQRHPLLSGSQDMGVNTHHDVLSVGQKPQQGLLNHIHARPADPLSLLLGEQETLPAGSLLQNVTVEPVEEQKPTIVQLGVEAPLSKCLLWQIQEDYYKGLGINAWEQNVPCFITSSVYIADAYADMVLAFLQDYRDRLDWSEPVYIVEMATGPGRFSRLMLKELERKLSYFSSLQGLQIKYVMTDFTEANPKFWEGHEKFKPYVDKGLLDFAVLNPLVDRSFELRVSGRTVSAETVKNPVIAIANYFFDSIPQDVFRVESKRLMEGMVTLDRNMDGVEPDSPPHITQITTRFRYRDLRNENYYDDPRLNAVLRHYKHNIKNGTVIFPVGAFEVVRNLQDLSNGNLMLISSDKAYSCADHMICFYEHQFAIHGGAFSYMVNYDAIGHYFKNAGGRYFHTTGKNLSLQTVCFVEMADKSVPYERLSYLYAERINRGNPITTICTLLPEDRQLSETGKLDHLIAFVRLNLADPKIFTLMGQQIVDLLPHATLGQREDLMALMSEAWDNFYYFPGEANLPFWLSQLYYYMERYEDSLRCLDKTAECFGEHEALWYLKGQNHERMNQWHKAGQMYEAALAIRPDFAEAQQALANVRTQLAS